MMKTNVTEKAIGLRVSPDLYKKITELCDNLDGMPINTFALRSVESAIEMLIAKSPKVPKWVAVQRYALNYKSEESLGG